MPFIESGITIDFPDNNYFQFSDCAAYNLIKSNSVKEMDLCWLEQSKDTLWAIELKTFTDASNVKFINQDLSSDRIAEYWINELYNKSVHTLCMLETNRSNTKSCLIDGITNITKIKLVHVINVIPGQESFLLPMKDKLQSLLKPYLAIFKISSVSIIPYSLYRGSELFPWIK